MQFKMYLFFIITSSIIAESFGRKCYSCSSTPSDYDNDCYNGYANVSSTTCSPDENTVCFSKVLNNFDGSFNVSRNCYTPSADSKDLAWTSSATYCSEDLCNVQIPHLDAPDVKCYFCTSTSTNFNEDCYYGHSNVPTITCEEYCSSEFVNNFDGTFNVSRDCFRYDQMKSNDITWSKYKVFCEGDLCNNVTPHIEQSSTSTSIEQSSTSTSIPTTDSSKASLSISRRQGAGLLLGALILFVIIT